MAYSSKNQIIACSSIWLAALLNFLPGLGTGYIYQRRWRAYWLTVAITTVFLTVDTVTQLTLDPSDPGNLNSSQTNLLGLLAISVVTSVESVIAVKKIRDNVE